MIKLFSKLIHDFFCKRLHKKHHIKKNISIGFGGIQCTSRFTFCTKCDKTIDEERGEPVYIDDGVRKNFEDDQLTNYPKGDPRNFN